MTNEKPYAKTFGFVLNPWQYEIFGCIVFYLLSIVSFLLYYSNSNCNNDSLDSALNHTILLIGILFLAIGIYSPVHVYLKYKAGYYYDDLSTD